MTNDWTVRPIQQDDAEDVYRVLSHYIDDDLLDAYSFPLDEFCSPRSPHAAFVAVADGDVIGVNAIFVEETLADVRSHLAGDTLPDLETLAGETPIPRAGYLASGYVHPEWTGHGIGRALLEQCEAHCRDHDCAAIFVEVWVYDANQDARGLLSSAGYEILFEPEEYWNITADDERTCSRCGNVCTCGGQIRRKLI